MVVADGESCTVDTPCRSGNCECQDLACAETVCSIADCDCRYNGDGDGECDGDLDVGESDPDDSCDGGTCNGAGGCQ